MKSKDGLALQTILVAVIIIVALIYALFIKPNYYKFNGGKVYFETIYSEGFMSKGAYEIHSYNNFLYFSSQDGFKKTTKDRTSIWDKSFYLENPRLFTENKYMAVVDMGGKEAYVFDDEGLLWDLKVEMPIILADISKEGILTIVQEGDGKHVIQLYNRKGKLAVERGTNYLDDGYPVAIDLSSTGEKMVTSYLSLKEGVMKTAVSFFGFTREGDKDPENILGGFMLEDSVAPEIKFLDDEHVAVVSNKGLSLYYIKNTPKLLKKIEFTNNIKLISYLEKNIVLYFGEMNGVAKDDLKDYIEIYNYEGDLIHKYKAQDQVKSLIIADSNYYVVTAKTIQYHTIKKQIWEVSLGKEAKNIQKISKNKFLIVYEQGYEIVSIKDI